MTCFVYIELHTFTPGQADLQRGSCCRNIKGRQTVHTYKHIFKHSPEFTDSHMHLVTHKHRGLILNGHHPRGGGISVSSPFCLCWRLKQYFNPSQMSQRVPSIISLSLENPPAPQTYCDLCLPTGGLQRRRTRHVAGSKGQQLRIRLHFLRCLWDRV